MLPIIHFFSRHRMQVRSIKCNYDIQEETKINAMIYDLHPVTLQKVRPKRQLKRQKDTVVNSEQDNE
jgi:hypothetical protein